MPKAGSWNAVSAPILLFNPIAPAVLTVKFSNSSVANTEAFSSKQHLRNKFTKSSHVFSVHILNPLPAADGAFSEFSIWAAQNSQKLYSRLGGDSVAEAKAVFRGVGEARKFEKKNATKEYFLEKTQKVSKI